ncbi:hypothetical protein B2G71_05845 [Novosphingobium sp. PC22D]|uniref:DUF4286 family protein n=1 Tax=Novosphingobium sp. PC22D TaxID=1962403 RepID=UPI000BF10074|nr:DUF4286 family protein [Novosphingobium sp. PC22D]PEQ13830.1 hypothetical protein B2G71_05845 [Novosphingobium sp. PC22D]
MAKYVMVVQSKAKPGRDDEYNEWYDSTHAPEILSLPGMKSCRRFDYAMGMAGEPGLPYLALYEVEIDDIQPILAEMGRRAESGEISQSDALDGPASVLWFYKQRD